MDLPIPAPEPGTPAASARRKRGQRRALALAVVLLAGALAAARLNTRAEIEAAESARLQAQAAAVADNLTRQLRGAHAALRGVRSALAGWPADRRTAIANERLSALCEAMPIVRSLHWLGADGTVIASSVPAMRFRPYADDAADAGRAGRTFPAAGQATADESVLSVSEPRRIAPGTVSADLRVAIVDAAGRFAGAVVATLDPDTFNGALGSALYARDMQALVAHGSGSLLLFSPAAARPVQADLGWAGSPYLRHLQAHRAASLIEGRLLPGEGARLTALRTLEIEGLPPDGPLVLALGRDSAAMWAPWRRQTAIYAALALLCSVAAGLVLLAAQRRRDTLDRVAQAAMRRQAVDAERLALALKGGDLGLWDAHVPSQTGVVNERWYTMLGWRPGEIASDEAGWRALLHPDDRDATLAAQAAHLEGRTGAYEATYRLRHRQGHWVWVLDRGRVVERDADGRPLRMVGTHMDVSARMQAGETLRRSEELLAITLHSIGDGVIATDVEGRVTRINATAERLTGWPADEALGQPLAALFRIDDAHPPPGGPASGMAGPGAGATAAGPVAGVLAQAQPALPLRGGVLLSRDGTRTPVATNAAPIRAADDEILGVVLVFSDIGPQDRMVQALRLSEHRVRTLLEALLAGVVVHDAAAAVIDANPAACRTLGLTLAQMRGQAPVDPGWCFLEEDRSTMDPARFPAQQVRATGQPVLAMIGAVQRPDLAEPLWMLCNALPVTDERGALAQIVVTFVDITERKLAEEALERSAARLRMTGRMARLGGWRLDVAAQQFLLSPESAALLRVDAHLPQSLPGMAALLAPAARERWQQRLDACMAGGTAFDDEFEAGESGVPGAPALQLRLLGEAVRDGTGAIVAVQGAVQDVSESHRAQQQLRLLERQLREAQRMESIGTLAGGIAHDFNNILAAILGNVALASEDLPADHAAQTSLGQIAKAGLRARSLVQQILAFGHRQAAPLEVQALRPALEETLAMLRATLPASVRLETVLADEPLLVRADATQLQQVLMNLCTNAWHALPEGRGRVEVGLEPVPAAAADDIAGLAVPGPCVHLWVRDTGSGMDAATRERIFDPFFTTKPVGRGTGLGLSVVHGIVRGHQGSLQVESAPGQGSTFHLYLPRVADGTPLHAPVPVPAVPPQGAGRQVLYVDDDEVMVIMVERLLQRAGHAVTVCRNGAQALALVHAQPDRFDLVVSDYNMPEMSGLELATALRQLRPELPVIITSGYIADALRQQAGPAGVRALLKKENTLEELPALVKRVLAREAG